MLPERKLLIHFLYPFMRRSWHLVSLFPVPLLTQVSHLSLLQNGLCCLLFSLVILSDSCKKKSIITELQFGCRHSKDKTQISSYSSGGLEMSQLSQPPVLGNQPHIWKITHLHSLGVGVALLVLFSWHMYLLSFAFLIMLPVKNFWMWLLEDKTE